MRRISYILIVLLAALLITQAAFSLQWTPTHDEAPLFYEAFLMQNGRLPYRDFFDFQMPGSYFAYYLFGILTNFGSLRIRLLDLFILIALLLITYFAMRRFGKLAALASITLFGLKYLQGGPSLSLQRDYLLLIFLSLAILIGVTDSLNFRKRLLLGLLFGLAATIKPHATLGLLPFLLFDIADLVKRSGISQLNIAKQSILPFAAGFLIPISLVTFWLAITHSLFPFISIVLNYIPLYAQINGEMAITPPNERIVYLLNQFWGLGGNLIWLIPAGFGIYLNRNRQTYLLASLALCYAIYPALSGQFFPYHYIPFTYCIILLASVSLSTFQPSTLNFKPSTLNLSSLILLLVILLNIRPSQTFIRQFEGKSIATSTDRAAQIADFLKKNLEPGDTVQDLDWTGGSLLAMLEARAPLATSYVFDFYFYHHVSTPYIQSLRADFMNQMQESKPRFIIEVISIDKPWVSGEDTSRDFPELRAFLNENYSVTIQKDDYIIYERK